MRSDGKIFPHFRGEHTGAFQTRSTRSRVASLRSLRSPARPRETRVIIGAPTGSKNSGGRRPKYGGFSAEWKTVALFSLAPPPAAVPAPLALKNVDDFEPPKNRATQTHLRPIILVLIYPVACIPESHQMPLILLRVTEQILPILTM